MTEYAKRMKRAARFGLDPAKVAGPQAKLDAAEQEGGQDEAMVDYQEAVDKMQMIQGTERVDRINKQIDRIKARKQRFGDEVEKVSEIKIKKLNKRITSLKAYEKPVEISKDSKIIEDSLYLYGTDFMSTNDIRNYFGTQFPEIEIKWINDSSCTIKFSGSEEADSAYHKFSVR